MIDISRKQHQTRVNGWRLKPYFSQVFNEKVDLDKVDYRKGATVSCKFCHGRSHVCHLYQVDLDKVSLDSDKPLGLIAQDPVLAQHDPCILRMNIGPITRPCIDTFLCNRGTSMEHLSIDRENECCCTSRL